MILMDVNVLVYAFRKDSINHMRYRDWLHGIINASDAYGLSDLVLSGFLRIVTHPKVFKQPSAWTEAYPDSPKYPGGILPGSPVDHKSCWAVAVSANGLTTSTPP